MNRALKKNTAVLMKIIGAWERIWLFCGKISLFKGDTYKSRALLKNRKEQGCFLDKNRGLGKNMALLRKKYGSFAEEAVSSKVDLRIDWGTYEPSHTQK